MTFGHCNSTKNLDDRGWSPVVCAVGGGYALPCAPLSPASPVAGDRGAPFFLRVPCGRRATQGCSPAPPAWLLTPRPSLSRCAGRMPGVAGPVIRSWTSLTLSRCAGHVGPCSVRARIGARSPGGVRSPDGARAGSRRPACSTKRPGPAAGGAGRACHFPRQAAPHRLRPRPADRRLHTLRIDIYRSLGWGLRRCQRSDLHPCRHESLGSDRRRRTGGAGRAARNRASSPR